jgi:prepilin-type N-terminal cleavage/methylation domain-containing protein
MKKRLQAYSSVNKLGFTLIELMVVIMILGILATIGLVIFSSAQVRGRDAQRKSDLKQISSALEIYYNDYETYPASSNGQILGCPSSTSTACTWDYGQFTDGKTIYLKAVPGDPTPDFDYFYRTVDVGGVTNSGFQLYAHIENYEDTGACIAGSCDKPPALPTGVRCGGDIGCNFSMTSPNTTYDVEDGRTIRLQ